MSLLKKGRKLILFLFSSAQIDEVEIVFLGTGGGRINLQKQIRGTAGFRIHSTINIHVDPGPGILFRAKQFKIDLKKTDMIIISHHHIDHFHDAPLLMEALTNYTLSPGKGTLLAPKEVIEGLKKLYPFQTSLLKELIVGKAGEEKNIDGIKLKLTKIEHGIDGFGFVMNIDGKNIGYTADSAYYENMEKEFDNCELVIMNVTTYKKVYNPHMNLDGAKRFIERCKAKRFVFTHFGLEMMRNITKVKELLKDYNVELAYDGMRIWI